jgi:hypothetical protein
MPGIDKTVREIDGALEKSKGNEPYLPDDHLWRESLYRIHNGVEKPRPKQQN